MSSKSQRRLEGISRYLSQTDPFSLLPEKALLQIAIQAKTSLYYKNMVLFRQNTTLLSHVAVVLNGRLELTILESEEILLRGFLQRKDIYGALSLLFNNGLSISTLTCLEDVELIRIPREIFLRTCRENKNFMSYFAEQFSGRLLPSKT